MSKRKTVTIREVDVKDWEIITTFAKDIHITVSELMSILASKIEDTDPYVLHEFRKQNEERYMNKLSEIKKMLR